jgi:hypothetical protein
MDAERWKCVDELLQAVLQVPTGRQEVFLRPACWSTRRCWPKSGRC